MPNYTVVAIQGRQHEQTFEVECSVPALKLAQRGAGRSRRAAEQDAARAALDHLRKMP